MSKEPKIQALEELAKAMQKLKLDKLKGYKKTKAPDLLAENDEEAEEMPEEMEEETPVLEAEVEEEEDSDAPKSFEQVLAAVKAKHAKKH